MGKEESKIEETVEPALDAKAKRLMIWDLEDSYSDDQQDDADEVVLEEELLAE